MMPTLRISELAAHYGVSPTFLLEAFRHLQLASDKDGRDSFVDGYYLDAFARRWADRLRRMTPEQRADLGPADAHIDPTYDEVCDELGIDLRTADLYRMELRVQLRLAEDEAYLDVEDAARLRSFVADLRHRATSPRSSRAEPQNGSNPQRTRHRERSGPKIADLARQMGVTVPWITARLESLGERPRGAASRVSAANEARLKEIAAPFVQPPVTRRPRPAPRRRARLPEQTLVERPPATSWTHNGVDQATEAMWRRVGLGDDDAVMAHRLLEKGILPEDLKLTIRGRRASTRLRGGEDSFANLVAEIREARSTPDRKVVRPDTKSVTRRPIRATPDEGDTQAG